MLHVCALFVEARCQVSSNCMDAGNWAWVLVRAASAPICLAVFLVTALPSKSLLITLDLYLNEFYISSHIIVVRNKKYKVYFNIVV